MTSQQCGNPGDLSLDFQRAMHEMAEARAATWEPTSGDLAKFENLARDDFQRSLLLLPDDVLLPLFKKSTPDKPDAFVQEVIDYMRREAESDPMAVLQILGTGERLSQALVTRSVNLEVALFIAQSTGALPVTDVSSLWNQLHDHPRTAQGRGSAPTNLGALRMAAVLNPFDGLSIAESSAAADARTALRGVLQATQSRSEDVAPNFEAVRKCLDTLRHDVARLHSSDAKIALELIPSMPTTGFELPTVQRLVVGFGRGELPIFVGLALFRATQGDESTNCRR